MITFANSFNAKIYFKNILEDYVFMMCKLFQTRITLKQKKFNIITLSLLFIFFV